MTYTDPVIVTSGAPGQQAAQSQPFVPPLLNPQQQPRTYTEDELNAERDRIRKEAQDKLYPELANARERAAAAEAKIQEREAAEAAARKAAEDAENAKRISEMSARDAVLEVQRQMEARVAEAERRAEATQALFLKEQEYGRLRSYRHQVASQLHDQILDNLMGELTGPQGDRLTTDAEIDQRAADLVRISNEIMNDVMAARADQLRGTRTVSPASGPPGFDPAAAMAQGEELDPSKIDWSQVSMEDYAKMRAKLPTGRAGVASNRGMFG